MITSFKEVNTFMIPPPTDVVQNASVITGEEGVEASAGMEMEHLHVSGEIFI